MRWLDTSACVTVAMRKMAQVALAMVCLASTSQGRRLQSPLSRYQGHPFIEGQDRPDQSSTQTGRVAASQALSKLLLALDPTTAFTSSLPGMHRQIRPPSSHSLDPQMFLGNLLGPRNPVIKKANAQSQVEQLIASEPITIFSKQGCPYSASAKEAFKKIGALRQATVLELDKLRPELAADMQDHLQSLTGARTVPRVFVGHKFIGGGTEVAQLAESGELKSLVNLAIQEYRDDLSGKEVRGSLIKSEEEWRKELSPEVYRILRTRGTEFPGSHEYDQFLPETGYFSCAGCDLPLYSASSKFRSNCGWPVFDKCYHSEEVGCHVSTRPDGTGALEILCPKCSGHLGHVFFDAFSPENPNGERH